MGDISIIGCVYVSPYVRFSKRIYIMQLCAGPKAPCGNLFKWFKKKFSKKFSKKIYILHACAGAEGPFVVTSLNGLKKFSKSSRKVLEKDLYIACVCGGRRPPCGNLFKWFKKRFKKDLEKFSKSSRKDLEKISKMFSKMF
jgi:hypothetical protein